METHINNPIELTANSKMYLKKASSQLKEKPKSNKQISRIFDKSSKKIKIFLVDDDPFFIRGLELSISGYLGSLIIHSFQTGEECLNQMKQKPAIVILDYYLNSQNPNAWDGLTVLRHIKQFYPKTKVIMLSSQDSLTVAIDCINNGAYDYVTKSPSCLIRMNNIISNIVGEIELTPSFYQTFQFILLLIVFLALIGIIMSL